MVEDGAVIENSVIGLRCRVGRNVTIRNSILMGNDYYEASDSLAHNESHDAPPLGVGEGVHIENAIVDKNCRIGRGVKIVNGQDVDWTAETCHGMIRDGIVVVPKETTLPDGWSP